MLDIKRSFASLRMTHHVFHEFFNNLTRPHSQTLFSKDDHPSDVLHKICNILCCMEELQGHEGSDLQFSENGRSGFIILRNKKVYEDTDKLS